MAELVIERVVTRRQKKEFLELPWTLYRGDPNWIPPLRASQQELIGYQAHPFYERNTAQTFLARRGGEVVLTSKLIDGTFPDYERVIPEGNDKVMKVDRGEFEEAVDRVTTVSAERGRAIKVALSQE